MTIFLTIATVFVAITALADDTLMNTGQASPAEQATTQQTTTKQTSTKQTSTKQTNKQTTTENSSTTDVQEDVAASQPVSDPLHSFNHAMFSFNDFIDKYFMKPIATIYNKIMPRPLNQGVHNFFNNIGELPILANDALQLHFYQFANDFWRLSINTTIGIGGVFDMATRMNLPYYSNDFGLTLARWGYQNSTYVVWPFFGPSTIRDGIGIPVDYYGFSIYPHIYPQRTRYQLYAFGVLDRRVQILHSEALFEEAAVDKYVFMRAAYMQHRKYQIEQNNHRSFADRNHE